MPDPVEDIADDELPEVEASSEPERKKSGPKLTATQWAEIRQYYEMGEMRTPALSEKYGVSTSAISQHFKEKKVVWGRLASAVAEAAAKKVEEETITFASKKINRIEQSKEHAWADAELIRVVTRNMLVECARDKVPFGDKAADLKALRQASEILRTVKDVRWHILEIDANTDPDDLPEIAILDYGEEDLKKIRAGGEEILEGEELVVEEEGEIPAS